MTLYLGENLISGVATPIEGARNIGQIIQSTIPLSDAGLHLLDGALINGSGSYADFVTYIAGLVNTYPDLFETEANWQTSVTNYDVCGKFVYDSVNNTVRLPKMTGFIEGTTDLTALGDLIEAGLPSATWAGSTSNRTAATVTTPVNVTQTLNESHKHTYYNAEQTEYNYVNILSGSIYGNSTTVQPQSIKVLYYIVLATSVKTQIEVDIDEIATDLNGKADVDLSNTNLSTFATKMNTAGIRTIVETYSNGASWYRVYSDGWCEQGGYVNPIPSGLTGSSVVFLKEFANTDYFSVPAWGSADYAAVTSGNRSTTGMTIINRTNSAQWCYWYTCGYIS